MNKSHAELKVGIFVLVCLAIVAALLIQFSKGSSFVRRSYPLILNAPNVGGLRAKAQVLMAGVQIGVVDRTELASEGTNVAIFLKIYNQYSVHDDAKFYIKQNGFLGDQYVSIEPSRNVGKIMTNNQVAYTEAPFDLQEVARSATGFIKRIDETARNLNDAINDVRRDVLNDRTLTNLAIALASLQRVSENAGTVVDNLNALISSNSVPAGAAISNLLLFSDRLNGLAQSAQGILNTNAPEISAAVSNLQNSTLVFNNVVADLQAGKGLAGSVLKNEELATNISVLASNLAAVSGTLRSNSFWHFLFSKPKPPEPGAASGSGRSPSP